MPKIEANAGSSSVWSGFATTYWYDDEMSTFHISTAEELAGLVNLCQNGKTMSGKTIILDNDIKLNDISNYNNWKSDPPKNNWVPIGNGGSFRGTFDGGGHNITGLYVFIERKETGKNTPTVRSGLFDTLESGGTIKNISCEYSYVYANSQHDYYEAGFNNHITGTKACAGGISACVNGGTILNCASKGYVYSTSSATYDTDSSLYGAFSGGICGFAYYNENYNYSIKNCYNQSNVGVGNGYSGGVLGFSNSKGVISNVYNTGSAGRGILHGYDVNYASKTKPQMEACYYLNSSASSGGAGNPIAKSADGMRSESFVTSLGSAFAYNPNGYPMLAWEVSEYSAKLDKDKVTLNKSGEQVTLRLTTNYTGTPTWISSDSNVATVENGVVTAVSSGTATIYVICGDMQATCTVKVDLSSDFALNYDNITMKIGEDLTLKTLNYNGTCTWLSTNTGIAKISSGGVITAVASGETVIYAILSNGKTLSCNVNVENAGLSGDVNNDGVVNVADVVLMQKYLIKVFDMTREGLLSSDMNSDGHVNVLDVVILKRRILQ
ncbi:MAG: dockerin type I domain-containing protein [Clostridium sp.]|nr:dockerin type I domain-containing protein [Clostridium sp.]